MHLRAEDIRRAPGQDFQLGPQPWRHAVGDDIRPQFFRVRWSINAANVPRAILHADQQHTAGCVRATLVRSTAFADERSRLISSVLPSGCLRRLARSTTRKLRNRQSYRAAQNRYGGELTDSPASCSRVLDMDHRTRTSKRSVDHVHCRRCLPRNFHPALPERRRACQRQSPHRAQESHARDCARSVRRHRNAWPWSTAECGNQELSSDRWHRRSSQSMRHPAP